MFCVKAQGQNSPFKLQQQFGIKSPSGWDYLSLYKGKLFVAHGSQVNVLDEATGDSLGVIPNTTGVHGIAFDAASGHGFTSNGRLNNVTVFDLKTLAVMTTIATGQNPDAIIREPFTGMIITCNGRSNDLTLIDPAKNTVVGSISVGGKPEEAASDGKGRLFVNIEDKNEVVCIDLVTRKVTQHWPLSADGPTGLKYDPATNRLFVGCEDKLLVLDSRDGKVVASIPIGAGCDGVAFWPKQKLIVTSNGQSGTLSVIREESANKFVSVATIPTQKSARTLTLDPVTGKIFLPAADFEKAAPNERPHMIPGSFRVLVYTPVK
jgi:YVTN family beta-propeller protein